MSEEAKVALSGDFAGVKDFVDAQIVSDKEMRVGLDNVLQVLKQSLASRERSLAITKIQEAIMWLGMDLKRLGEMRPGSAPNPYPNSYNPSNAIVDPTADGLKL